MLSSLCHQGRQIWTSMMEQCPTSRCICFLLNHQILPEIGQTIFVRLCNIVYQAIMTSPKGFSILAFLMDSLYAWLLDLASFAVWLHRTFEIQRGWSFGQRIELIVLVYQKPFPREIVRQLRSELQRVFFHHIISL